jgi:hypothetical protein
LETLARLFVFFDGGFGMIFGLCNLLASLLNRQTITEAFHQRVYSMGSVSRNFFFNSWFCSLWFATNKREINSGLFPEIVPSSYMRQNPSRFFE